MYTSFRPELEWNKHYKSHYNSSWYTNTSYNSSYLSTIQASLPEITKIVLNILCNGILWMSI